MSTTNDGGPAFPQPNQEYANGQIEYGHPGMSVRTWLAGQALSGLAGKVMEPHGASALSELSERIGEEPNALLADMAVNMAEILIARLEKGGAGE